MSRVASNPILLPQGVEVTFSAQTVSVKGPKGILTQHVHRKVEFIEKETETGMRALECKYLSNDREAKMNAGTARALVANMVKGITEGFEKRLELVGVGYRAQLNGNKLSLSLGYSHPIEHEIPEGIFVEMPSPTLVVIKGNDKQKVGQVAAKIREYRSPEPYKGKGIRYEGEKIRIKETKKK